MRVRPVTPADRAGWLRMREALWPSDPGEHAGEIDRFFRGESREPLAVLVAERHGRLVGLAELSIHPYAEGCDTDRVGFLEGWWVDPDHRRQGIGRALVEAAERWAREQGCVEFASDTQPGNATSRAAHLALGFREAGTVICFAKRLET